MNASKDHLHWLADIMAAIVVGSIVVFAGMAITGVFGANLSAVGATWLGLYGFIVIMSATKLYGRKIYNAVKGIASELL